MPVHRVMFLMLVLTGFLAGCSSMGGNPGERIIGDWRSELAGFTLVTSYSADAVMIAGEAARPYMLEGDLLIIAGDRTTARRITFPSRNEMQQTDIITGTVHEYTRIKN